MERIDHIIISAENFKEAVQDFREAGFEVFFGTREAKATNALIFLNDHSFIELLKANVAPPIVRWLTQLGIMKFFSPYYNRIGHYALAQEPILDYAVYSGNLRGLYERVRASSSEIREHRRKRPDRSFVLWQFLMPKNLKLPFVMSDFYPNRMTRQETNVHPNGITGIGAINVQFDGEQIAVIDNLVRFFQILPENISTHSQGFSVKTENAIVNYTKSARQRINSVMLTPYSETVNQRLRKYGIRTTNPTDLLSNQNLLTGS
ncbi:MAG: VOC family protein [Chloroflexota bacterium]